MLLVGAGLLRAVGPGAEAVAAELVGHLHLNPAKGLPHVFLQAAEHTSNTRLVALAALAFGYAAIRFAEGYGLWHERAWAEWLAALSGAIYMPFEVAELLRGPSLLKATTFGVNLAVVAFMAWRLAARRRGFANRVR